MSRRQCLECGREVPILTSSTTLLDCPSCGSQQWVAIAESEPVASPVLPPSLAPTYHFEEPIGRGASAVVYRARRLQDGRTVAIKVMTQDVRDVARIRFIREAKRYASFQHPNIIAMLDANLSASPPYIVLEFVAGRSLRDLISASGALEYELVTRLSTECLEGLSACHQKGVVHRDLKPENVLLTAEGSVKIADMGISLIRDDPDRLTQTGALIGTPTYMSPEQARTEQASPRSDVYAMGLMMYEMLSGRMPFDSANAWVSYISGQPVDMIPLSKLAPRVPTSVGELIHRAIAFNPNDRPHDATAMLRELRQLTEAPANTVRHRRRPSYILLLVTLFIVGVAATWTWFKPQSRHASQFELIEQLIDQERVADATRLLETLLKNDPTERNARLWLARLSFRTKDWSRAREHLQVALAAKPCAVTVLGQLSLVHQHLGQKAQADEFLNRALECAPQSAAAHQFRGQVLLMRGQPKQAQTALERAAELSKGDLAGINLGEILLDAGISTTAESVFRAVLREHPEDPSGPTALGHLLMTTGRKNEGERQFAEALRRCRTPEAHHKTALWLLRRGHLQEAQQHWEFVTGNNATEAAYLTAAALQLLAFNAPADADRLLIRALRVTPGVSRLHELRAMALGRLSQPQQALRELEEALAAEQLSARTALLRGELLEKADRQPEARRWYSDAILQFPVDARLRTGFAEFAVRCGDLRRAETQFREALRIDPRCASAYEGLGELLGRQKLWDAALENFRAYLQVFPKSTYALYRLGLLEQGQGHWKAAAGWYQKRLEESPPSSTVYEQLGRCLMKTGDVEAAVAAYKKALEVDPANDAARNSLSNLLLIMGRFGEASRYGGQRNRQRSSDTSNDRASPGMSAH